MSYRNAVYNGRDETIELFTWDSEGNRVRYTTPFQPYLFIEGNGEFESIYGSKLKKKIFKNQYERFKFLQETGMKRVFESLPATQQYLVDQYWEVNEDNEFNKHSLKIQFIDIETYPRLYKSTTVVEIKERDSKFTERCLLRDLHKYEKTHTVYDTELKKWEEIKACCFYKSEFPDINNPTQEINVLTIYDSITNRFFSWGTRKCDLQIDDVTYIYCESEKILYTKFVEFIENDYPDILSGWNSAFFDIPYIISRGIHIMGEEFIKRISPVQNVYSRSIRGQFGKEQIKWFIDGISSIDYLDLYKRFSPGLRESYKLDAIGEYELGEKKIDYGNQNLASLADKDWKLFVEYNIQDVRLLKRMEEKLKYVELLRMLAYIGLTTFENAMSTLAVINGSTAITARKRNQRIPTFIRNEDNGKNPGAYVAEPKKGFQKHILSFDANSLYPNVMISLNMSPETKVGKIISKEGNNVTLRHVNGKTYDLSIEKFVQFLNKEEISISKSNVLFTQKRKGIMPEILDTYYNKRVSVREELGKLKKEAAAIEKLIQELENK
jgi:DNA polymerase elongation subunit (family B)